MLRITIGLGLALCLLGWGLTHQQVPLSTVETDRQRCIWTNEVLDVAADPTYGTIIKSSGEPLRWPAGYTARRWWSEVEVRDPAGNLALTTGWRTVVASLAAFEPGLASPVEFMVSWVVGEAPPCPDGPLGQLESQPEPTR